jgi:hypothetical protein
MQIACDNLYRTTKPKRRDKEDWVITKDDYVDLGGVEGQMEDHLDRVLEELCQRIGIRDREVPNEMDRWKKVLNELVKSQVDGTVTTELREEGQLDQTARDVGCKIDFGVAMNYLAEDDVRILRPVEVITLSGGRRLKCYSLGHDAIGLTLRRWQVRRSDNKMQETKFWWAAVYTNLAFITLVFGTAWVAWSLLSKSEIVVFEKLSSWLKQRDQVLTLLLSLLGPVFALGVKTFRSEAVDRLIAATITLYIVILPKSVSRSLMRGKVLRNIVHQYPDLRSRIERQLGAGYVRERFRRD